MDTLNLIEDLTQGQLVVVPYFPEATIGLLPEPIKLPLRIKTNQSEIIKKKNFSGGLNLENHLIRILTLEEDIEQDSLIFGNESMFDLDQLLNDNEMIILGIEENYIPKKIEPQPRLEEETHRTAQISNASLLFIDESLENSLLEQGYLDT